MKKEKHLWKCSSTLTDTHAFKVLFEIKAIAIEIKLILEHMLASYLILCAQIERILLAAPVEQNS